MPAGGYVATVGGGEGNAASAAMLPSPEVGDLYLAIRRPATV